jgi:hypothetical protein
MGDKIIKTGLGSSVIIISTSSHDDTLRGFLNGKILTINRRQVRGTDEEIEQAARSSSKLIDDYVMNALRKVFESAERTLPERPPVKKEPAKKKKANINTAVNLHLFEQMLENGDTDAQAN